MTSLKTLNMAWIGGSDLMHFTHIVILSVMSVNCKKLVSFFTAKIQAEIVSIGQHGHFQIVPFSGTSLEYISLYGVYAKRSLPPSGPPSGYKLQCVGVLFDTELKFTVNHTYHFPWNSLMDLITIQSGLTSCILNIHSVIGRHPKY